MIFNNGTVTRIFVLQGKTVVLGQSSPNSKSFRLYLDGAFMGNVALSHETYFPLEKLGISNEFLDAINEQKNGRQDVKKVNDNNIVDL